MHKFNVLIAGSTGYIGVELIKLLIKHPFIRIRFLCGNSSIGKKISYFDKSLNSVNLPRIVKFNKKYLKDVDIIFTALPNGQAQLIAKHLLEKNTLIDLAADFRLEKTSEYLKWYKQKHKAPKLIRKSIYLLPEINSQKLDGHKIIACPGCYPTSILLPLVPLIKKKLIKQDNIIIDSKSGYSGAGRKVHKKYEKQNLYESISAYGISIHRHNPEIEQMFEKLTNQNFKFTFTPHLSPMFRGILSTIYLDLNKKVTIQSINKELKKFYSKSKFVKILKMNSTISTNNVINTNNCEISVIKSKYMDKIIILSAIDNLIKGGAGQGIQNMNIAMGLNENEGLL
ncbi:N-acetyl-gamma-glutamyl-phosphate reductase [Candidatus Pelagibacter sp.]|nr:N-acetyl-gamma-glutamyl-phosphate reductase [Candidatus Pelagibacter sp.]